MVHIKQCIQNNFIEMKNNSFFQLKHDYRPTFTYGITSNKSFHAPAYETTHSIVARLTRVNHFHAFVNIYKIGTEYG